MGLKRTRSLGKNRRRLSENKDGRTGRGPG